MAKRIIIILLAGLVLIVGFLGTLYYLITHSTAGEDSSGSPNSGIMGTFFKNPENAVESQGNGTTTVGGGTTVIQVGTSSTVTESLTVIPASIVYVASDSPNKVVLAIESVGKTEKGTVLVAIKALTFEAEGATSLNPANFLVLIPRTGGEIHADFVQGNFTNMAPGASYAGNVVFTMPAGRSTLILQVGSGQAVVFFEFDFNEKTFRQVEIS